MAYVGNTPTTQAFVAAVDYFSGNASTTAFTLSRPVASVAQVQAVIENVPQNPGSAFTVSGSTITFTSAPPSGSNNIYVYYTSPITEVIAPSPGTVTNSSFASGASEFASGTALLFNQTSAPTGWTKSTTHDNKALRVVSGTASSGGSVAFTTAFASQAVSGTVGSYTLTTSDIPSHTHNFTFNREHASGNTSQYYYLSTGGANVLEIWSTGDRTVTQGISSTGGGGGHSHSFSGTAINLAVQYVDVIIATKN